MILPIGDADTTRALPACGLLLKTSISTVFLDALLRRQDKIIHKIV